MHVPSLSFERQIDDFQGINIDGHNNTKNLRCADDTVLLAEKKRKLIKFIRNNEIKQLKDGTQHESSASASEELQESESESEVLQESESEELQVSESEELQESESEVLQESESEELQE
ncbi:hypothetical protein ElyMa_004394600 [Elysia marginata]|uniref:Uncharacterized protein n=1 Tax=Elysia marginata TaxID=1093978 RepID=A0AAV4H8R0_9GAST|nr:hypothetical protein ElyMa_004394600 [Elysia marginata]